MGQRSALPKTVGSFPRRRELPCRSQFWRGREPRAQASCASYSFASGWSRRRAILEFSDARVGRLPVVVDDPVAARCGPRLEACRRGSRPVCPEVRL